MEVLILKSSSFIVKLIHLTLPFRLAFELLGLSISAPPRLLTRITEYTFSSSVISLSLVVKVTTRDARDSGYSRYPLIGVMSDTEVAMTFASLENIINE